MNLLDKLERKFHKYAIKNLMFHIIVLNMIVFILHLFQPEVTSYFYLIPSRIMHGEVWRLITYVFIPPVLGRSNIIWIIFILNLYYIIGTGLEHEWGSFKFNLFYLVGMIGTTIASFIISHFVGDLAATATFLNLSLFLAFARLFPNFEILIFFLIPVKIKYLAWIQWFFLGAVILLPFFPLILKVSAIVSIMNYFLFFGKDIIMNSRARSSSVYRKTKFKLSIPQKDHMHKCTVCGITEKDDSLMEFRYCMTCEGRYEYCMEHLKNHEHIKNEDVKINENSKEG